jgi:predicted nucleotide-binding protein (sugar kinase/HSP70/actin superfamily)
MLAKSNNPIARPGGGNSTNMKAEKEVNFGSLTENVGKFHFGETTVLIPAMNRIAAHLFAATFRGFGVHAKVLETYKGLDLGKEHTSGKECYPCQITLGDILYFIEKEKERLGKAFDPERYVYFLPESDGPCRFGLYNKYQRIVLDSFPGLSGLKITSLTTRDGYSLEGMLEPDKVLDFQKAGYFSLVVADILDRLLWKIRPYEKEPGITDAFIDQSMHVMEDIFEINGPKKEFSRILDKLEEVIEKGKTLIDPCIPPKPLIGVVGEIFLRMHVGANQDLVRVLERHGAEVVNASLAEWVNYISYEGLRRAKTEFWLALKQLHLGPIKSCLREAISFGADLAYKELRQRQVYARVRPLIAVAEDHKISHLEHVLKENDLFSFEVGTEACLSIAAIVECARTGFNGIVNVYPFTCMPGTTTSAVVKPLVNELGVPYLDAPYDSSIQPGRETAIRTFMYQANQHYKRRGRSGIAKSALLRTR